MLLTNRSCLVVGGGSVACRKISGLLDAGALVTVVAIRVNPEILSLAGDHRLSLHLRPYQESDLQSMRLVFAATGNPEINARIIADCREKRILCCAVDHHWPAGDFITPASFQHEGVTVSISTGGSSCKEAKQVRKILEKQLKNLG
ncbi:MAG: bifunctional precorrin-2 dehydrogenase/sirohydrochlorin ferrochelatase [Deltaproteobacteria bacterium]|nr:bifunctional precorrin-2 dehydrogenase/sirohydrochlorin ferrochelatase [Deltaproteobacteria bacterium]